VSPNTTLGFALAGGATNWGLASNLGTGKSDAFQAGAYASTRAGPAYLSAAAAYALHWASTDRTVTLVGLDRLEASFNAQSFGGRIEGGYRFGVPAFGLTPYAAGQVLGVRTPAYTERATAGTNAFALSYDAKTATSSRSELGLWADSTAMLDAGSSLLLRARAAWAHNFNTDRTINALFQTLPGASGRHGAGLGRSGAADGERLDARRQVRRRVRCRHPELRRDRNLALRVVRLRVGRRCAVDRARLRFACCVRWRRSPACTGYFLSRSFSPRPCQIHDASSTINSNTAAAISPAMLIMTIVLY
jgi:uncharacterized protein YhjY with autotransporter beta-barrel domain